MGTSNSNKGIRGKGTPLIPTWLDVGTDIGTTPEEEGTEQNTEQNTPDSPPSYPPFPTAADPNRFRTVRSNFSKFARSGGQDKASLGRALSEYTSRSAGGAGNAAKRMGSSRKASAKLVGFLSDVAERGLPEVLRSLNLDELVGKPIGDLFLGLADYICPEGGGVDEGVARESYITTITELSRDESIDMDNLNTDQIQAFLELYATNVIETRILNDIGINAVSLPQDEEAVEKVHKQVHVIIKNGVSDALAGARESLETLTPSNVGSYVDSVYEQAFTFLVALGDAENE